MNCYLLKILTVKEIIGKYRGSFFGFLWSFLNPLFMLFLYLYVFGYIFKARYGIEGETIGLYGLVLYLGLISYNVFAESINRSADIIMTNVSYVKKVIFPLELLVVSVVLSSVFHFMLNFVIWLVVCLLFDIKIYFSIMLFFVLLPLVFLSIGFGWFIASLSVYIKDIKQIIPIITSGLMFLSPIFYKKEQVGQNLIFIININPLTHIIEFLRNILIFNIKPNYYDIFVLFMISFIVLVFGCFWFIKTKKGFADVI